MENDPNKPSPNPTHAWMRLIMWILPTGFLGMSVGGFGLLTHIGETTLIAVSILLNLCFAIGAGWCDYQLSPPARKNQLSPPARKNYRSPGMAILQFILSQVFLVPILLGAGVSIIRRFCPDLF